MRMPYAGRGVTVAVLALVALGCARPGVGDGDSSPMRPQSPSPSVSATATATANAAPPGDGAPHHAENNGWKQRHDLTAEEQRAGDTLAARIRPKLEALRDAKDFSLESTRRELLGLGIPAPDVQVTTMWVPIGESTPPPGAVFAVRFPEAGCVVGAVRPDRLRIEVDGANPEFGCLEPSTH